MNNSQENKKLNDKGFSLVELIIVIAIMAVLVGVLAPQYIKYVEKSRVSTDQDNVAAIVSALQVYAVDPDATVSFKNGDNIKITASSITPTDSNGAVLAALQEAGIVTSALSELPKLTNTQTFSDVTITVSVTENATSNTNTINVTTSWTDM